ncbi:MAG: hypothetical protein C6I01_02325 [Epsilonproteobacteria bacterium]|nr:hypothetical protein [Campylobacterota bacterium]NPA89691.1 hypothetical protein [Campylobacterota bacterium]
MDAKGTDKKVTIKEFFEKFPLEEIQQVTKISIISLQKLKSGEYLSMPRVKFYGFIRILEQHYPNVDFSPLVENYENANPKKDDMPVITSSLSDEKGEREKGKGSWWIIGLGLAVVAGGYFLVQRAEKSKKITEQPEKSKVVNFEYNVSQFTPTPVIEHNLSKKEENSTLAKGDEGNESKEGNESLASGVQNEGNLSKGEENKEVNSKKIPEYVVIFPKQRVWVQVKDSDTGKVIRQGTFSKKRVLKLKIKEHNYTIKTGNEFFILQYGDKNFTNFPEGVNRIKIENGELIINGEKAKQ